MNIVGDITMDENTMNNAFKKASGFLGSINSSETLMMDSDIQTLLFGTIIDSDWNTYASKYGVDDASDNIRDEVGNSVDAITDQLVASHALAIAQKIFASENFKKEARTYVPENVLDNDALLMIVAVRLSEKINSYIANWHGVVAGENYRYDHDAVEQYSSPGNAYHVGYDSVVEDSGWRRSSEYWLQEILDEYVKQNSKVETPVR